MGATAWSQHDIEVVTEHYATGGSKAVIPRLKVKRDRHAVHRMAGKLGIRYNRPYSRQEMTPLLLKDLEKVYAEGKRGALQAVADKHGVNYGWLKYQAQMRGLSHTSNKCRWRPEMDAILADCEGLGPNYARRRLKQEGYFLTLSQVASRLQKLKISTECMDAMAIAHLEEFLGVPHQKIKRWVESGKLRTFYRDNSQGEKHAYTWIKAKALREFIIQHPGEIDLRRVQPAYQSWLIDVLTNKRAD